jgi:hypothetical protein
MTNLKSSKVVCPLEHAIHDFFSIAIIWRELLLISVESWTKDEEETETDAQQWADDWDDEQLDDDFSKQLR